MLFDAGKSTFAYIWLFVLQFGSGHQGIFNTFQTKSFNISTAWSPVLPPFKTPVSVRHPRASPKLVRPLCSAPPQPANGEWRLRQDFCENFNANCKVPEGTKLELGFQLEYTCSTGYRADDNSIVYCRSNGNWSRIPSCVRITCDTLNSVMRVAYCSRSRQTVSCDFPVAPKTQARVSCRPGYTEDTTSLAWSRRNVLTCNEDGRWEPSPLRCKPVCGQATTRQQPLVIHGTNATIGDFPWHVSLYRKESKDQTKIEFICGSTLIQTNLLLTAAHCVYNERYRMTVDPEKLFVMTGNIFREYDDPRHDPDIVRKGAVRIVHVYHTYLGITGNYLSDIALLELKHPFVASGILLPACLDNSRYGAFFLEPGVYGRLAGFGTTATGENSLNLQTITVPYIPYSVCKTSKNAAENAAFITKDKFCAGYTNGSAVCEGDSGGGLVFQINEQWHVMGVVSVGLGVNTSNGAATCERYAYTLYTRVSEYMEWILEVISDMEQRKGSSVATSAAPTPIITHLNSPASDTPTVTSPTTQTSTENSKNEIQCAVLNSISRIATCSTRWGDWISCDSPMSPGTKAIVSCRIGYEKDSTSMSMDDVECSSIGKWEPSPITCTPVCGRTSFIGNGTDAKIADFPWHASIYIGAFTSKETRKEFLCGATLIQDNVLLTAAHCVYNEVEGSTVDPRKLFVMMGNVYRDYDSPLHDLATVRRGTVKNVYKNCQYDGITKNYSSDIALLQLEEPFLLSDIISIACLEFEGDAAQILDVGASGRVSGFGRTKSSSSSVMLKTITVPYISYMQCEQSSGHDTNKVFNGTDKFCGGYSNGSVLCGSDSGSGLVFEKNNVWYVMGVVSVGFGMDLKKNQVTCDRFSYSLYTRVSSYVSWIYLALLRLNRFESFPQSCDTKISFHIVSNQAGRR